MVQSSFPSPIYDRLFGDDELAEILSPERQMDRMVLFEAKLARVQGALGVIPAEAAQAIEKALAEVRVDPADLIAPTASAGVPVPGLAALLRDEIPDRHGQWLHWGATSQDVVDTAHMLGFAEALGVVAARLGVLLDVLQSQAEEHRGLVMAARTRSQIATPITFGLRVAQWAQPLIRAETAKTVCFAENLRVQFGGASGANSAVAPDGPEIARGLAEALGLTAGPVWHTDRGPVLALMEWCCGITRGLAKMAEDMILMMRPEIAELSAGQGGGSSTMPQKSNPVGPEAILTLAYLAETAKAGLAVPHREERDGAAWAVEWALVPQILLATGAALRHAQGLAETLVPDAEQMRANLEAHPGVLAEAASFALARHMSRPGAQALVKEALASERGFAAALGALGPKGLDWAEVLSAEQVIPACEAQITEVFSLRP